MLVMVQGRGRFDEIVFDDCYGVRVDGDWCIGWN